MKLSTKPTVKILGEYAYQAIQTHFSKTLKHEKAVKKDKVELAEWRLLVRYSVQMED